MTAPFGPFARGLAEAITAQGGHVSRIFLNSGDALTWRRRGGIPFRDSPELWPTRLAQLAADFTDIIVFGENGPYNQGVLTQAATLSAAVWVLENGYFRPDWVTVERNGVNASSGLPRHRDAYDTIAIAARARPIGSILPHHVLNITLYHLLQGLGAAFYPRYVNPYTQSPWLQAVGHIRRYISLRFRPQRECDAIRIARRGSFFIACLQREGDAQLLRYSSYADNTAFLAEVLTSFAEHAPSEARLVIKNHPLDPGLTDLARITRLLAVERGVEGRVDFIDGGSLAQLCRASRGMIVNNSSAALSALGFHTPVKVLGSAFFDFGGLTDQQPLDAFWKDPQEPDADLFMRFRSHVIARSQINGNYHEPRARRSTAARLAHFFVRAER
ncbi:capsular biosynthesis protein [Brevundimonas sp.]|uniref:capsular biosynthesis protein n=1 Tax=Brevundimonas sp. TaxID=1871086 RepID=UPI0025C015C3|nr:capsular biosynthesis protein [Brevundimonas sp.]